MVSIRLPLIVAERIRELGLRWYSLAKTQWCIAVPFSKCSCTLSSTRTWIVPSVKAMPKNWLFCSLKRASASLALNLSFLQLLLLTLSLHSFHGLVVNFFEVSRTDILRAVQVFAKSVKHSDKVAPKSGVLNRVAIADTDYEWMPNRIGSIPKSV